MKLSTKISVLCVLLVFAGCASMDARDRLNQAEAAYSAVVDTAIELRRAEVLGDEAAMRLTPAFVEANELLDRAHQAIVDGDYGLADEHRRAAEALIAAISRRMAEHE